MPSPPAPPALLACLILAAPAWVWAGPPRVSEVSPLGVRRGESEELDIVGSGLDANPSLVAAFPVAIESAGEVEGGRWTPTIRVGPGVPIGVYPVRVRTDDGLSNPSLLAVGQLPRVAEAESNDTPETAQRIQVPAIVEGRAEGNDVDFFRFSGRRGDRIVIDAQCARIGSGMDPTIRLTTAGRGFVASADDTAGLLIDARLAAVLPADGDYAIEISDSQYKGGNRPVYRLLVGTLPVADEIYPLGGRRGETVGFELRGGTMDGTEVAAATLTPPDGGRSAHPRLSGLGAIPGLDLESAPTRVVGDLPEIREPAQAGSEPLKVVAPIVVNGRIDPPGEEDRFVLAATPGQTFRIRVEAAWLGSALDGEIRVLGADGAVVASNDDTSVPPLPSEAQPKANATPTPTLSPDPSLEVTTPADRTELTVVVRDLEGRGGIGFPYRLAIEPAVPDFALGLVATEASLPRGGTMAVEVSVVRRGHKGPITLDLAGSPPAGVTARPGRIGPGQDVGALTLTVAPDARFEPTVLQVEGRAEAPGGPIVRRATGALVFARQGPLPTNLVTQVGLPVALARPGRIALDGPGEPIEVVQGLEAVVPIRVDRSEGADAAFELSALGGPPGLSVAKLNAAEEAAEASLIVKATPEAPIGRATLVIVGRGKLGAEAFEVAAPALEVDVVRPAVVELAAPGVEVAAGRSAEVRGRVVRRGAFRGPVTLRIDGLPDGLASRPLTIAPEASDFALALEAGPDVKPAKAAAELKVALKLGDKDHDTPPLPLSIQVVPAP